MKELFSFLRSDQIGTDPGTRRLYSKDCLPQATFLEAQGKWEKEVPLVLFPEEEEELIEIARVCSQEGISWLPYGGGTGVCGAVTNQTPPFVVIAMKRMDRILHFDPFSQTLEVQAGISGLDLENYLQSRGFTLGHFPASMNSASLGGYLSCRSAGQCSSRYGKIEDMVLSLNVVLPGGRLLKLPRAPKMAMGPDFVQLFTGAEGTLGIISSALLAVRRQPQARAFFAFSFQAIEEGIAFMKEVMQAQLRPAILRLYDPLDTFVFKMTYRKKRKEKKKKFSLQSLFLNHPFFFHPFLNLTKKRESLLIAILEGSLSEVQFLKRSLAKILKETKGSLDQEFWAHAFFEHRFSINFFLPQVLSRGYLVDTCEVATFWKNLIPLYQAVLQALESEAIVFAHFSHAYETGCCIYFTFVCKEKSYETTWNKILAACAENGGVISHHHGIGQLKRKALETYFPDQAFLWDKIKEALKK